MPSTNDLTTAAAAAEYPSQFLEALPGLHQDTVAQNDTLNQLDQLELPPGMVAVYFYAAGATHIMDFSRPLKVPAFKAGLTRGYWGARIDDLRRERYASLLVNSSISPWEVIQFKESTEWFLCPLDQTMMEGQAMPEGLSFHRGAIRIVIPATSFKTLDLFLHRWLKSRSLQDFLKTGKGQQLMAAAGYDPQSWLYTAYRRTGSKERFSPAEEIYMIKPRKELPAIVAALARLREAVVSIDRKTNGDRGAEGPQRA